MNDGRAAPRATPGPAAGSLCRRRPLPSIAITLLLVLGAVPSDLVRAAPAAATTAASTAAPTAPAFLQPPGPLCEWPFCNCTDRASWVVAVCNLPKNQEVEVVSGALPAALLELHARGGAGLRLAAGAFAALPDLRLLNVSAVAGAVTLRKHAFVNASARAPQLHVAATDCAALVLETQAFRWGAGSGAGASARAQPPPVSLDARRVGHVVLQSNVFARLQRATLRDVARLELAPNAFALEQPEGRRHGPLSSVVLERVMVAELPPHAFPSQVAEVRLVQAQVRTVRRDAFYALQFSAVALLNSSLQSVEAGAFSARTLVLDLSVRGSRVGVLASGALRGAVASFAVVDSHVEAVEEGAVAVTAARVALRNTQWGSVGARGLAFEEWVSVWVQGNVFGELGAGAVWTPFDYVKDVARYEMRWEDNAVRVPHAGALASVANALQRARADAREQLVVEVTSLRLEWACRCDLGAHLSGREGGAGSEGQAAAEGLLLQATSCAVEPVLARCLDLPEGERRRSPAADYARRFCDDAQRTLRCEAALADADATSDALPPPSAAADPPDRGRKVLALVFAGVVLGSLAVLAASGALWLRRKGYCRAGRWAPPASAASCLAQLTRLWAARSPGRAAPHAPGAAAPAPNHVAPASAAHYTELRTRRGGAAADDPDEEAEGEGEGAEAEDKWTQTLPEELTQELLQALREKLDDPDNYSEARDMIEHLYDLIKVEESCSNNNRAGGVGAGSGSCSGAGGGAGAASGAGSLADLLDTDDDNLYEAIRPRVRRARTADTCSVGTRAPSPDALEPPAAPCTPSPARAHAHASAARAPLLCEYVEPRDRAQHLYAELPPAAVAAPPTRASRPLSFLRSLGETLQAVLPSRGAPPPTSPPPPPPTAAASPPGSPPAAPRPAAPAADVAALATSLLCEYAEPTDAQVHVYSELPPAMVNRPLPDTPAGRASAAAAAASSTRL